MSRFRYRAQPKLWTADGLVMRRVPKSAALHPDVVQIIRQTQRRYRVSASFVIATALNHYFGVESVTFHDGPVRTSMRKKEAQ